MYMFARIFKQTTKLFGASILASSIFAGLLNNLIFTKPLVFTMLLLASLILFLYIYRGICFSLLTLTENPHEYILASIIPFVIYIASASVLYFFRLSEIYIWVFLPTRFLEPVFHSHEKFSFAATYLIMFLIMIRYPIKAYTSIRAMEEAEALEEELIRETL